MRVRLLYFASVRELLAVDEEHVELPPDIARVSDLSRWLEDTRPLLRGQLGQVRFAIDESFAERSDMLHPDAVIAIIPPVAGG